MRAKSDLRLSYIIIALLIIGYAAFFSVQLLLHYYSFGSRALDLGNMSQAIWNTAHGRWFHQTNQPGAVSRLSLHVEPILIPISLLYWIYNGPEILFVFQSIVVALGAIPVFALARHALRSDGLALVFALLYLLFPAIQAATLLDFHAVTLAPTFLLAAFYYLQTGRPGRFALFAALAAASKEEMALLVLMMGLYALLVRRRWKFGLLTILLSGLWAFIAVFVIQSILAGTGNIHWGRYDHLGRTPVEIVFNFFWQPSLVINHLRRVEALTYLRLLLTPTAFTALLSPATLLLALPSLGINLLSSFPPMQRVNSLIYAAPLVPAVIISSIFGAARLQRWSLRLTARLPRARVLTNSLLAALLLTAALGYHAVYGYLPGGGQFRGWEQITDHHRRAARIFAQIPQDAALSAQDRLNPHLATRETLYIFDRIEDAEYIVLDVTEDSWPLHPVDLRHRVDEFLRTGFGIVDAYDGYLLLARNQPDLPTTLPDEFFDFARVPNPGIFRPRYPVSVTFDDRLRLAGYDLTLGAHEKFLPVVTLYWQALRPLDEDYTLWPFILDRDGNVIETPAERPLVATLWYPPSRWSPDELIITRMLPRDLAPNIGDEFTVAVGVTASDWAAPDSRLPVTAADSQLYRFDRNTWVRLATFRRTGRKTYEPVQPTENPRPAQSRQAQFYNLISLRGVDLPQSVLKPGDSLPLTLYWQADAPVAVDLTAFVHVMDEQNQVVAQLDRTPQDALGYLPTSAWQPGRLVVERLSVPLPSDLPPGRYRLVAGWYYPLTGDRLPITAGNPAVSSPNAALLGKIQIEK